MSLYESSLGESSSGIKVTVSPSKSAYFAGEPFLVTITFSNTNSAISSQRSSHARGPPTHRRSAQSVSLGPINPPTTPGTPKTPSYVFGHTSAAPAQEPTPRRKGLVGKAKSRESLSGSDAVPPDPKRKHPLRSQSVSSSVWEATPVSPQDPERPVLPRLGSNPGPHTLNSPTIPRLPSSSPLARPPFHQIIPKSHPHARKESVHDAQSQLHDISPSPSGASTPFTASLDTINESASTSTDTSPAPTTPAFPGIGDFFSLGRKNSLDASVVRDSTRGPHRPIPLSQTRRKSIGHGPPPMSPGIAHLSPRTTFSSSFSPPGTEVLLWAYAQLAGTIELDTMTVPSDEVDFLRSRLRTGGAVGGGRMDIDASRSPGNKGGFISSFFASPTLSPSSARSSPSLLSSLFSPSPVMSPGRHPASFGIGIGIGQDAEAMPTFESQQSMLVVDLNLAPGESRSYTYSIQLPSILPPTFRGKAFRFSYHLVIGTSRSSSSQPATISPLTPINMDKHRSRVLRVPIRVYNHVAVGKQQTPYDLLWPVARRREKPAQAQVEELRSSTPKTTNRHIGRADALAGLESLGESLLANTNGSTRTNGIARREATIDDEFSEPAIGCREAVEVLTRNPKKVSYDIAKEGEQVAVLTFIKSAYRLGETVLGIVDINLRGGHTRVVKFSASLEAHETIPSTIAAHSHTLPRVHSEYHCSLAVNTLRASFALDIPADATPAFRILCADDEDEDGVQSSGHDPGGGGLEWKVRMCFLVAVSQSEMRNVQPDGQPGEWGVSFRAGDTLAPFTRVVASSTVVEQPATWSSMLSSPFVGSTPKPESQDGEDEGIWREVRLDMVECEVPIKVWPGATLFRPVESFFDT